MPVGSIALSSPTWWGFQYLQNSSKILWRVSLEGEPGPCPKAALLFLDCSSLVSASPPFPDQQLFEPALWNSGEVMEAEVYSLQTRNGGHRKTSIPRSPAGSCLVSPGWCSHHQFLTLHFLIFLDSAASRSKSRVGLRHFSSSERLEGQESAERFRMARGYLSCSDKLCWSLCSWGYRCCLCDAPQKLLVIIWGSCSSSVKCYCP